MAPDEVLGSLSTACVVDGKRVTLRRGDVIPAGLGDDDRARLKRRGSIVSRSEFAEAEARREAFKDQGEQLAVPAQEAASIDVAAASDEELAAHIADQKLNVDATVALAAGDPGLAARVLVAEGAATAGKPRKGVVDGLEKIGD